MRILHIDIETFSSVELKKSGLYKYVQSTDFEIILFAYAYDDEPVRVIDCLQGEEIPLSVLNDLQNPEVIKVAHNAAFELMQSANFTELFLTSGDVPWFMHYTVASPDPLRGWEMP